MPFIKEALKFLAADVAADAIVKTIKENAGGVLKDQMEKQLKSNDEYRAELEAFLGKLARIDSDAVEGIRRAYNEREKRIGSYLPGSENQMAKAMINLFKGLSDKVEEDDRIAIFQELGHNALDDRESFDNTISRLTDNKLTQFLERIVYEYKRLGKGILNIGTKAGIAAPIVLQKADDMAGKAATGINKLTGWINKL